MDLILPFKVGDTIESRSYSAGYRGAWFRCKITDMCIRSGHMECQVEYIDYPDEKRRWNRLYKVPPKCRNQKSGQNRDIMIRPPFPQWCWENDIPEHGSQLDVVAVVSSSWKVGDLIDWWYTGCFWTGRITELLGDDRVKIVCPEKPLGEGGCYDAELKDLRPALDWSLEKGWSTPLSQENGECWHTARLIAGNQDTGSSSSDEEDIEQSCDGKKELQRCLNGSFDTPEQEIGKCFNEASDTPEELVDPDVKRPANTNGRCCMQSQIHGEEERQKCMNEEPDTSPKVIDSKLQLAPNEIGECCTNSQEDFAASPAEEPQKCMSEEPDTSPDVIDSKLQLAPNEIGECCMNSQADFPMSPAANSGKSPRYLTDGQSSPPNFKKLKASSDHDASVEPTDTVGEAMMDLERLANKIRRAQELLQSVDYAPSNIVLAPWKFLENNPSAKHN